MYGLRMPRLLRLLSRQLGHRDDPLRRRCDRLEGAVILALLIAGLAAVIIAGVGALRTEHFAEGLAATQAAHRHRVVAVLLADAQPTVADGSVAVVQASWPVAESGTRSGPIEVPAAARAGDRREIWTDSAGAVVQRPMTRADIIGLAIASAIGIILVAMTVLLGLYRIARWLIDRVRLSAWDADWATTAPLWTDQSR